MRQRCVAESCNRRIPMLLQSLSLLVGEVYKYARFNLQSTRTYPCVSFKRVPLHRYGIIGQTSMDHAVFESQTLAVRGRFAEARPRPSCTPSLVHDSPMR